MTLEKHVIDTVKEWQTKIGTDDAGVRLYYPKVSMCGYLKLPVEEDSEKICQEAEAYFEKSVPELGHVTVTEKADRFCVFVSPEGCDYINREIPVSEFLEGFLKVLKTQDMQQVRAYFQAFAKAHGTTVCEEDDEEDLGTVLSFADKDVEPYLYCVTDDQFGITYHRFTKDDFDTIEKSLTQKRSLIKKIQFGYNHDLK